MRPARCFLPWHYRSQSPASKIACVPCGGDKAPGDTRCALLSSHSHANLPWSAMRWTVVSKRPPSRSNGCPDSSFPGHGFRAVHLPVVLSGPASLSVGTRGATRRAPLSHRFPMRALVATHWTDRRGVFTITAVYRYSYTPSPSRSQHRESVCPTSPLAPFFFGAHPTPGNRSRAPDAKPPRDAPF